MSFPDISTWGLKLSGAENQNLRFLIRCCQRSLVAIPGYGIPLLQSLMPLAARYRSSLDALLTLSTRLRYSEAQMKGIHVRGESPLAMHANHPNLASSRYQGTVSTLQSILSRLQPGGDDIEEAVALSMILWIFGFPGHDIWSVHLNGLIALIEATQPQMFSSPPLYSLAVHVAAHADIKALSCGRIEPSKRLWLRWNMCSLERWQLHELDATDFSGFVITSGYPESLITVIALVSAVVEDDLAGQDLDPICREYFETFAKSQQIFQPTGLEVEPKYILPTPANERNATWTTIMETIIARWQPPRIPEDMPLDTGLTLSTAWELIRKATLIYLWRGGFDMDIFAPLSHQKESLIYRFVREMCLGFDQVIQAAERYHITVANALIWPLMVIASECSRYPELQPRISEYLRRIYTYFMIPHHQIAGNLLQRLWEKAESRRGLSETSDREKNTKIVYAMTAEEKLKHLSQQYERNHPQSKKAFERAQQFLPGGSTRSVLVSHPFPLVVKSAQDTKFTTIDGLTFEDFVSDFSAGIYGHSHPAIKEAIQGALSIGFSLGAITEKEAELARILIQRFPSFEKVRFCNSGTEANTFALATAVAYTQRKKILVFDHGYHGGTISFGAESNPMNLPHEFIVGTYNSIDDTRTLLNDEIAAILIEPMQAAGGMRPATLEFLQFLRQAATDMGAILIFDEVVTSRLHYNGLQGAWNIKPDMTTVGKYLGGGLPFGAFGGSARIMDRFDSPDQSKSLHHSGTFNNNIFTLSAAVAASELITETEIQRLNSLGDRLRLQANELLRQSGISHIFFSGYGSAVGIHFTGDEADTLRDCFFFFLLKHGLSIGRRGFVSLNLMHTEASIDRLLEAVESFLGNVMEVSIIRQKI